MKRTAADSQKHEIEKSLYETMEYGTIENSGEPRKAPYTVALNQRVSGSNPDGRTNRFARLRTRPFTGAFAGLQNRGEHSPLVPDNIEPHAGLLEMPPLGQQLHKVLSLKNLLSSIQGSYLHFQRVDTFSDLHDGEQPPSERARNEKSAFAKSPEFRWADWCDRQRGRTYAFCLSLEDGEYIWREYGQGDPRGKVCLVFDFGKLREVINNTLRADRCLGVYDGRPGPQIFDVNYGRVRYVDFANHLEKGDRLQNAIIYAYRKDERPYWEDKELRITLTPRLLGYYSLGDGVYQFPKSIRVLFDFRAAFNDGVITRFLVSPPDGQEHLQATLGELGLPLPAPRPASARSR